MLDSSQAPARPHARVEQLEQIAPSTTAPPGSPTGEIWASVVMSGDAKTSCAPPRATAKAGDDLVEHQHDAAPRRLLTHRRTKAGRNGTWP